MIKIRLVCVGNLKEKFLVEGVGEYAKRLQKFCSFEVVEVSEAKSFSKLNDSEINTIKEIEGEAILSKLKGYVVALCIQGKQFSSEDFSQEIQDLVNSGVGEITFVIGGSYGLSDKVIQKSNLKLSFSKFTFPHQLMRLIFVEQIYRAFNIASHSAYHK